MVARTFRCTRHCEPRARRAPTGTLADSSERKPPRRQPRNIPARPRVSRSRDSAPRDLARAPFQRLQVAGWKPSGQGGAKRDADSDLGARYAADVKYELFYWPEIQ